MGNLSCCSTKSTDVYQQSNEPTADKSASNLSHVGKAAYEILRTKHAKYHKSQWNITQSKMIGVLQQTPSPLLLKNGGKASNHHSDWFADKMHAVMSRTTKWCDVMSLAAPDGYFLERFKEALKNISDNGKKTTEPIVVRLMFGNIIGLPINCQLLTRRLTEDLSKDSNIRVWVGAWRNGVTWNHAKIIAVDGRYLHTGGHNLWSDIYLKKEPVHDVSVEMEGMVAYDAHMFANTQWEFVEKQEGSWFGAFVDTIIPDNLPLPAPSRVNITEFPHGIATINASYFKTSCVLPYDTPEDAISVISVGRQGTLVHDNRPADDAFIAMFDASQRIIRMSLQDIGPRTLPGIKVALPTVGWPTHYLDALARAIWLRGVDVEIVLSNVNARHGYTNGWSCADVGSEIIKRIEKQFPNASAVQLRQKVEDNLRICYIRHAKQCKYSKSDREIGNHAKYFIVDDVCTYIGSQNLYECDLAEWGVLLDDDRTAKRMLEEYWKPLWEASYIKEDCEVDKVMDGLSIDREGDNVHTVSPHDIRASVIANGRAQLPAHNEFYDKDEEECTASDLSHSFIVQPQILLVENPL
mmetsp:Transcript_29296/g.32420  ORF Transcript_29296/g.32420 Transcript_29296/m.32420 type:complete len:580 (-) Transcript_29296:31-1770(-)